MCGIAGIVSGNTGERKALRLRAAVDCLRHRGPEGEGIYEAPSGKAALGHRRLRIIDLSPEAAQPLHYGDRYTIIHNGELYNYVELRDELTAIGHSFRSRSDTEVIVAAYAAWGADCLRRFDGMFAFAIWDEREELLFAARDRFGEKPFFFYTDEQQLLFASELKALRNLGAPFEVNKALLYNFLSIGYTGNPADGKETFYEGIFKLPAAHFLRCSPRDMQVELERWWQLDINVEERMNEADAIEEFRQRFNASVARRLRSDVSIGTSLSGGLDSSSVVAFCERQPASQYGHQCFTVSFEGVMDEKHWAELVAKRFGLEHHIAHIHARELPGLMEKVMAAQEEPFSSASVLAQYKVYELARRHNVTVLLDGQGADEVLAGYHHYYRWYWQELYRQRRLGRSGELKAARALGVHTPFGWKEKMAALYPEFTAGLLQGRKAKAAHLHPDLNRDFAFGHKRDLYYATPTSFDLNGALYFNTAVQGLEELLRLADRNSMSHAVEIRLPFLEHGLVEFLFRLPPSLKIHEGWTKWLLRKSVESDLPKEIVWRRDKRGFEPPQRAWMKEPHVKDAIMAGKKKLVQAGILDRQVLRAYRPHEAYSATGRDWRYWSASFLF